MAVSKVILCESKSPPVGKLCAAVKHRNYKLVREMIESGEDVNQVDENGETALIIAASLEYTEVS